MQTIAVRQSPNVSVGTPEQKIQHAHELCIYKERLISSKRKVMESYYDLISWYEDTYRLNAPDNWRTEIRTAAKECFNLLKHEKALYSEWKFMKILLKYIEVSGKTSKGTNDSASSDFFNYMYLNGIGTNHADFFIAWAHVLESNNLIPAANIIFNRGIECGALPLETLLREKDLFHERVARHSLSQQLELVRQGVEVMATASANERGLTDVAGMCPKLDSKKKRNKRTASPTREPVRLLMFNEQALAVRKGKQISFEEWRALHYSSHEKADSTATSASGYYQFLSSVSSSDSLRGKTAGDPTDVVAKDSPFCKRIAKKPKLEESRSENGCLDDSTVKYVWKVTKPDSETPQFF